VRLAPALLFPIAVLAAGFPPRVVEADPRPPLALSPSGAMDRRLVPECSALVASARHPRVIWTLSDSGAAPRLVAVRPSGLAVAPASPGVTVTGAANLDWEALTTDGQGNLIIGDVGNNLSRRRELHLYVVPEPDPSAPATAPARRLAFSWPDQTQYPDPEQRHDCEAIFWHKGRLHLLTKHRRDTLTTVWRAEPAPGSDRAYLTQLGAFEARGMVTDASVSPDGRWLAVLTYRVLWVFDLSGAPDNPLSGKVHARALAPPVGQWQLEGCAWADDTAILLGSEEGGVFRVPLADVVR
jgi:hypothetical protein